eukprot:CAMPEP_0169459724 /NCGR_PEP_ID=MMETSP1042-20121227/18103_1 /TAXON_ID=464988 /ORGANISM="Hemiselmis andersenii, Strain CCMP1180" /LENGTH=167 /DNA_ID=CAMNT_0009572161 /DNA_START=131 /DNA_END=630 /DNA_ORIENTATION=-
MNRTGVSRSAPGSRMPSRPGTSLGAAPRVRPGTAAGMSSSSMPTSEEVELEDALHGAKQMLSNPKMPTPDRDTVVGLVDGVAFMKAQRMEYQRRIQELETSLQQMTSVSEAMEVKVSGLENKLKEYGKVDVVQSIMNHEELEDSIVEIEGACNRYSRSKAGGGGGGG